MQIGLLAVLILFVLVVMMADSKGFPINVLRGDVILIIWPFVFLTQVLPELLARKRYVAAKEAGLILCSK